MTQGGFVGFFPATSSPAVTGQGGFQNGDFYFDTDAGAWYYFNAGIWLSSAAKPFVTVSPNGVSDGGDYSPSQLQTALNTGLPVYLKPGTPGTPNYYPVSSTTLQMTFAQQLFSLNRRTALLQATANNQTLITGASGGTIASNCIVDGIGFDAGGFTGCTGLDFHGTESAPVNRFRRLFFNGNWTTCIQADGNEDSIIDDVFTAGAGDVYAHVNGGQIELNRIVLNNANEAVLHIGGQTVIVSNSVLNSVLFDAQAGVAVTSLQIEFDTCYMANATNSAGQHKFRSADGSSVRALTIKNGYVGLKNSNAVFANTGSTTNFSVPRLTMLNNTFQNMDSSSIVWIANSSSGTINVGGGTNNLADGSPYFFYGGNATTGTITAGANINNGYKAFAFSPAVIPWTVASWLNTSTNLVIPLGGATAPVASTTYTVSVFGVKLFVSGGTSVAISINGNATGLASGYFFLTPSETINFGAFSGAPTLLAEFVHGW